MKKLKINSILFIVIIIFFGIWNTLDFNKPTVSELENRTLAKLPSFSFDGMVSGKITQDIENYYNDTFVNRENFVLLSHDIKTAFSFVDASDALKLTYAGDDTIPVSNNEDTLPDDAAVETSAQQTSSPSGDTKVTDPQSADKTLQPTGQGGTAQTTSGTATSDKRPINTSKMGFWLINNGKRVQVASFKKQALDDYAKVLNEFSDKLGNNVTLYSVIPPETGEVVEMKKYPGVYESQNDGVIYLNSIFNKNVKAVDIFDSINRHKDEYVYLRSDHHWNGLGSYYGYSALMQLAGNIPEKLSNYVVTKVEGSLGSIYRNTLNKALKDNPDTIELYKPPVEYTFTIHEGTNERQSEIFDMSYASKTDKYSIFMSTGGGTWSVIKTNVKNGKKILVIKDSFGNTFSPFLMSNYEEVYTVDARFYNKNYTGKNIVKFIQDNGIQDVVFVIYMGDVMGGGTFMDTVQKLLN